MNLPIFKLILAATNLSILTFLTGLTIDHYLSHNNFKSWSSIFNILSLLWLTLRGSFWLLTIILVDETYPLTLYIVYWMANPLQIASFMLLPLFSAQILYPDLYKKYAVYVRPIYLAVLLGLVVFTVYVYTEEKQKQFECLYYNSQIYHSANCYSTEISNAVLKCLTGMCFLVLAAFQTLNGIKITYLDRQVYDRYFYTSRSVLAAVNAFLVCSFFSRFTRFYRGIYQFISTLDRFTMPSIPIQGNKDVDFLILFLFLFWDYIPTIILIVTVTTRTVGMKPREGGLKRSSSTVVERTHVKYGSMSPSQSPVIVSYLDRNYGDMENGLDSRRLSRLDGAQRSSSSDAIDLRGLERFAAPVHLTPNGTWLGGRDFEDSKAAGPTAITSAEQKISPDMLQLNEGMLSTSQLQYYRSVIGYMQEIKNPVAAENHSPFDISKDSFMNDSLRPGNGSEAIVTHLAPMNPAAAGVGSAFAALSAAGLSGNRVHATAPNSGAGVSSASLNQNIRGYSPSLRIIQENADIQNSPSSGSGPILSARAGTSNDALTSNLPAMVSASISAMNNVVNSSTGPPMALATRERRLLRPILNRESDPQLPFAD